MRDEYGNRVSDPDRDRGGEIGWIDRPDGLDDSDEDEPSSPRPRRVPEIRLPGRYDRLD